jgi:WD40 repeat protein
VLPIDGDGPVVTLRGHTLFVRGMGFTRDGQSVITAGSDGSVRLWDANTGAERRSFDWGIGKLYAAAFSPDGLTCAAGSENGQVVVWDVDA